MVRSLKKGINEMSQNCNEHAECLISEWHTKVSKAIATTKEMVEPLKESTSLAAFKEYKDASPFIKAAEAISNPVSHLGSYLKACPQCSYSAVQERLKEAQALHAKHLAVICVFDCWQLIERPKLTNQEKGIAARDKATSFLITAETEHYRCYVSTHVAAAIEETVKKCKDKIP